MRAAILYGPDDLRLEAVPDPMPGRGEVMIAVEAALTCGTDLKMLHRGHPALPPYPASFGHEFAGRIAAVGTGVDGWTVGQRVVASDSSPCGACFFCNRGQEELCENLEYTFGGFAELLRLPARLVARNLLAVPDGVPAAEAALAEPLASVLHGLDRARVAAGEWVAVLGGGALGLMLAVAARERGADVLLCDPHLGRLQLARSLGIDTLQGRGPELVPTVRKVSPGGRGADLAVEAVGKTEAWQSVVAMARPGGRALLFGGCARGTEVGVPTERIHYEEVDLLGSYHHAPAYMRAALYAIASGFPAARFISDRRLLDGLPGALADMERDRDRYLKICIEP